MITFVLVITTSLMYTHKPFVTSQSIYLCVTKEVKLYIIIITRGVGMNFNLRGRGGG